MLAPNFRLPAVKGGVYHLTNLKGQVVLMSFVNARPTDASLSKGDTSRSQIVFLKSIEEQYGPKGVQILIVDATAVEGRQQLSSDELLNYSYDWVLAPIQVLMDADSAATARDYGILKLPTTILIAPRPLPAPGKLACYRHPLMLFPKFKRYDPHIRPGLHYKRSAIGYPHLWTGIGLA
jgi:hypothetical protein